MLSVEGLKLSGDPTVQPELRTVATEGSAGTVCAAEPARWMFRATSLELLPVPWQSSWCPQAWGSLKTSGVALPKVETEKDGLEWDGGNGRTVDSPKAGLCEGRCRPGPQLQKEEKMG